MCTVVIAGGTGGGGGGGVYTFPPDFILALQISLITRN